MLFHEKLCMIRLKCSKKIWSSVTEAEHLGNLSTLTRNDKLEEVRVMTPEDSGLTVVDTERS